MNRLISVALVSAVLTGNAIADETSNEFIGVFSTSTPHFQSLTDEQMASISGHGWRDLIKDVADTFIDNKRRRPYPRIPPIWVSFR